MRSLVINSVELCVEFIRVIQILGDVVKVQSILRFGMTAT